MKRPSAAIQILAVAAEPPVPQLERDLKELSRVADGYPPRVKTPEEQRPANSETEGVL